MDLLGRKAQRELAEVRAKFAGALVALIATQTELRRASSDYRSAVMLLMEKTQTIKELQDRLTPKKATYSPVPLYLTDEEEDLEWAVGAEAITLEEAADILKELDFDNDQVYLDGDRSSLTY